MAVVVDMALLAHLDLSASPTERRSSQRRRLRLESNHGEAGTPVVIHDISEQGMLLESEGPLSAGEQIDVLIPESGPAKASVMWTSGRYFGCRFDPPIPTSAVSGALLRSPVRPSGEERQRALTEALAELRGLAREIEQITDRVDAAIDELKRRMPR